MNRAGCENLDGFLDEELSTGEASRFAAHLEICERCREAVDQQWWIDGLLRSPLVAGVEVTPEALLTRVHTREIQHRRRARFIACGLAVAAAVIVAAGWTIVLNRQANGTSDAKTASVALTRVGEELASAPSLDALEEVTPRATFVGGPDVLVVPVASRHPNVTVVRVYSAYQPEYTAQASADTPAALDEFNWTDDLNGG